ncbi:hypothetical protein [Methylomonas sp. MgM2]
MSDETFFVGDFGLADIAHPLMHNKISTARPIWMAHAARCAAIVVGTGWLEDMLKFAE